MAWPVSMPVRPLFAAPDQSLLAQPVTVIDLFSFAKPFPDDIRRETWESPDGHVVFYRDDGELTNYGTIQSEGNGSFIEATDGTEMQSTIMEPSGQWRDRATVGFWMPVL